MARHEHKVARSHLERQESSARRSALRVREAAKKAMASYATAGRNKPALLDERRGARRRSACRAEGNPDSESCLTGSIATTPAGSRTAGFLFFRHLRNAIQVRTPGRRNGPSGSSRWIAASIVSGLASGFSAHSHEIECVLAVVVVHENDSAAGSIRAVRPTLPRDP